MIFRCLTKLSLWILFLSKKLEVGSEKLEVRGELLKNQNLCVQSLRRKIK